MIDPTRVRQLEELDLVSLGERILDGARNELYLNMRFLDVSLSSLSFAGDPGCGTFAVDGEFLYYHPEHLCRLYQKGRVLVNRSYFHMVLHCLFCHMYTRKGRDKEGWDLACDIAVESVIDGMYQKCTWVHPSPYRRELYGRLREALPVLTAEGIYRQIQGMGLDGRAFGRMVTEFLVDGHQIWESGQEPPNARIPRQEQWQENRERMEVELELYGTDEAASPRTLMEQIKVENRERHDYKQFLRKFSVWREEVSVDPDSFDYVFYTYGLSLYGNMPLVEPLETREVKRIEEFVIVIDTSMSCSGELVAAFLEETYDVLSEQESFFKKVHLHIIQCDEQIQSDEVIRNREDMERYMEHFTVIGQGGTDFRPAFEYVGMLARQQRFKNLRGLIYFTDGKGIYPVKKPAYETAFVFMEGQYQDLSVPSWAIKLVLDPEEIEPREKKGQDG